MEKLMQHKKNESFELDFSFSNVFDKRINPSELKKYWSRFIADTKKEQKKGDIDLYIHIPYCVSKCRYCQYYSRLPQDENELQDYLRFVVDYLSYFKVVFDGVLLRHLYIGGGTPSMLSAKQIDELLTFINVNYRFKEANLNQSEFAHTFELNPLSTNFEKLTVLKKQGINRISFGVQSFNKSTLEKEGRGYVSPEVLNKIVLKAKNLGFTEINVDLIVGLNNEKKREMLKSLRKLCEIEPTSITLYTLQKNIKTSCLYSTPDNFYKKVEKIFVVLEDVLHEHDYVGNLDKNNVAIGQMYIKKDVPMCYSAYELHAQKGNSIFAVGDNASGLICGHLRYNNMQYLDVKVNRKFDAAKSTAFAIEVTLKEEMISYILRQLQSGLLDSNYFYDLFGKQVKDVFSGELNFLKENNVIEEFDGCHQWKIKSSWDKYRYSSIFLTNKMVYLMTNHPF